MDRLRFYDIFAPVFQTYKDNRRVIMKNSVQWNPVYGWKFFSPQADHEPVTARSTGSD